MTLFGLVKIALDELYAEANKEYGDDTDKNILKRMQYLSKSYGQLNSKDREPVDYGDPATRFAYAYKYVAAHGDYVVQLLQKLRNHLNGPIFQGASARVSCIGGGPGSDIIAVLKYLDESAQQEPVKKLTCYLLDKEQAWADTWTELDDSLEVGISLNANFQPLDVTKPASWKSQQKFLQADVFTLIYFVSEVRSLDNEGVVSNFFTTIFSEAKSGAMFLYIDNGHNDFNQYFDTQWEAAGLKLLGRGNNERWYPRMSEQASELAIYKNKFEYDPKIQAWLSYRLLRKT